MTTLLRESEEPSGMVRTIAEPLLRPGFTERAIVTVALFVMLYGEPTSWFRTRADVLAGETAPWSVLLTLGLIGLGVMRTLGSIDLTIKVIQYEPAIFAFASLMLISLFWSIDRYLTARWGILLIGGTLYAVYLFLRFELYEFLTMFMVASLIGGVVCLVFVFALPQYGVAAGQVGDDAGAWSAVFSQKNALGFTSAITIPSVLILDRAAPRWRFWSRLTVALHVPLLLGSQSKTMLVATGLSVGLMFFYKAFRARKTMRGAVMTALVGSTIFSVGFATANLALLARWLDKDVTLTGRTVLWESLFDPIERSFLIGYGYNVAFTDEFGPLFEVFLENNWGVSHAHNAIFQMMLDCGIVGVILYLVFFIRGLSRAIETTRRVPGPLGLWPLTYMTTVLMISISEPGVSGGGLGWTMLVLAVLYAKKGSTMPLIADVEAAQAAARQEALDRQTNLPVS